MKIVIWTGAAWEPWGPTSIDAGGIGGSETAAVHMSKQLALLGHEVVMAGDHEGFEGVVHYVSPRNHEVRRKLEEARQIIGRGPTEGELELPLDSRVDYVDYRRAIRENNLLNCDVFISSRDKRAHRLEPKCRLKILWVHDANVGDDWENDLLSWDRIYCLSEWHKDYFLGVYPHVPPEVVSVTRNGIDVSRFHPEMSWMELAKKKKPKFVWSSSPDRGLDVMLDVWPRIVANCQEAELHVYYGFENWRKLNAQNKRGLTIIDYMEGRLHTMAMEKRGIFYHGRVGQRELAEAQLEAMVWGYPTAFCETSCITAMETQAAGCIPVTTRLGALSETVLVGQDLINTTNRKVLLEPHNKQARYQDEFVTAVQAHLESWAQSQRANGQPLDLSPGKWDGTVVPGLAAEAREKGLKLGWEDVARQWELDFKTKIVT
jgi:glycosyltransferase involved in cell wall biosynthesis